MASFAPIPDVPMEGLNAAESSLFRALKENVELLCGLNAQSPVHAMTNDKVIQWDGRNPAIVPIKAGANGYATSYAGGAGLPNPVFIVNYQDYANLIQDVQQLQNAVTYLTAVVNSLITQLRS